MLAIFSVPSQNVTNGNNQIIKLIPVQGEMVSDILAGDGKTTNLFYSAVACAAPGLSSLHYRGLAAPGHVHTHGASMICLLRSAF